MLLEKGMVEVASIVQHVVMKNELGITKWILWSFLERTTSRDKNRNITLLGTSISISKGSFEDVVAFFQGRPRWDMLNVLNVSSMEGTANFRCEEFRNISLQTCKESLSWIVDDPKKLDDDGLPDCLRCLPGDHFLRFVGRVSEKLFSMNCRQPGG